MGRTIVENVLHARIMMVNVTDHMIVAAAVSVKNPCLQPFLPSFPQSQAFHRLADARALFGVSNAMDTLSNFAFLLGGAAGLVLMVRRRAFAPVTAPSAMASLTFAGFVTTAAGSAWYHSQLAPDDAGLIYVVVEGSVSFVSVEEVSKHDY